jgi:hypothetical protein
MRACFQAVGLVLLGSRALYGQGDSVGGDSSSSYRNRIIGLPYVTYSPQTRLQFGAAGGYQFKWPGRASDPETRPSYVAANGSYTQKGQWIAYLGASLYTPVSRWWYSVDLSGGYFPVFYYGVGSRTEEADTNLMQSRFLAVNLRALRRISREWYVGPAFRLGSIYDLRWQFPGQIPATLRGGRGGVSAGLGATALLEGRNSTTTPTRGGYFQLDYLRQARAWGSDFGYSHLTVDSRIYLPVRRGRDVVALTLYGEYNGAGVPIQSMAMLGNVTSQTIMRGVYLGRFRDRHTLVTQAEYRGHLKGRFGYVVFGAGGNVFGSGANGLFDRFKVTYGAGLRFNVNPADPLNLRADFTLTSFGGGGLSLGATEAF